MDNLPLRVYSRISSARALHPNVVRWIIEHYHLTFSSTEEEVYKFKEGQDDVL